MLFILVLSPSAESDAVWIAGSSAANSLSCPGGPALSETSAQQRSRASGGAGAGVSIWTADPAELTTQLELE